MIYAAFSAVVGRLAKVPRPVWLALAIFICVAVILTLTYCAGGSHERGKQDQRTIKTERALGKANDKAADRRVVDSIQIEQQKKELSDALDASPNLDRQRALRGCAILRQQGRDTSHLPACR